MNLNQVKTHFEEEAATYNDHILKFIPHYLEQNALMMDLLPYDTESEIRVLDLGAGTGVLSGLVLQKYPQAHVHVFDLAENMIAAARDMLREYADRVTFQSGDFSKADFGQGYDLILSGLAIHHLDHPGKQELFERLYLALRPGGMLLIRDIVRGETDAIAAVYEKLWCDYIRSMHTDEQAVINRYHSEDVPARLEAQLGWMRASGFMEVDCHWKYLNFAIFGGVKP